MRKFFKRVRIGCYKFLYDAACGEIYHFLRVEKDARRLKRAIRKADHYQALLAKNGINIA